MMSRKSIALVLETLEDRWCPSTAMINSEGNLEITGTLGEDPPASASGGILSLEQVAPGEWEFDDLGDADPVATFNTFGHIIIDIPEANGADSIGIDLGGFPMTNNLLVEIGAGDDTLTITDSSFIAGDVVGFGVNQLDFTATTTVGGSVYVDTSNENIVGGATYDLTDVTVLTHVLVITGTSNETVILSSPVGQNVYLDLGNGMNTFMPPSTAPIGGSLTYLGGSGMDMVTLGSDIGGHAHINLGGGSNTLSLPGGSTINGSLQVIGGSGDDDFVTFAGTVEQDVMINFGGGLNRVNFQGAANGRLFMYFGGSGIDRVRLNGDAGGAFHYLSFGGGDDELEVGFLASLSFLYADMGAGNDTFNDLLGMVLYYPRQIYRL